MVANGLEIRERLVRLHEEPERVKAQMIKAVLLLVILLSGPVGMQRHNLLHVPL